MTCTVITAQASKAFPTLDSDDFTLFAESVADAIEVEPETRILRKIWDAARKELYVVFAQHCAMKSMCFVLLPQKQVSDPTPSAFQCRTRLLLSTRHH